MSYIVYKAEAVRARIREVRGTILEERAKRDQEAIDTVIGNNPIRFGFWRCHKRNRTVEEAISYLNSSNMFGWRSMYAYEDLKRLKQLEALVSQDIEEVFVSAEDARILWG